MIERSTAWGLLSQRPGPTHVLAKMYYGDESEYLPIGSGFVNLEGEDFLPLITTIPNRFQEVDFWTREFSVADLTLEILNLPFHGSTRFSDLLDERGAGNDVGFENRPADVRLWRPGITTWADCFSLFPVGVMRKPYVQGGIVYVEMQDGTFLYLQNVDFPVLTDADAAIVNKGLPESSVGLIKPRIYGDRINHKGDDLRTADVSAEPLNLTRCRYLGPDASGDHRWLVSGHKVDEINNHTADPEQQQIWGKDEDLDRFVRLFTEFTVVQNTAAGCIISHPNEPEFLDYWYPDGPVTQNSGGVVTPFPVATAPTIDRDFTTKITGSIDNGSAPADFIELSVTWNAYDDQSLPDADISEVKWLWYGKITLGGGAVAGDFSLTIDGVAGVDKPIGASYPNLRLAYALLTSTQNDIGGVVGEDIRLKKGGGVAAAKTAAFDFYEVYKQIKYTRHRNLDLYFGGKSAEIDANWTNRAVVDGYDEQHADHGGSGNLGENLATLIELTLRNDADLTDDQLNLNSLNSASVAVAGLKGAPTFVEKPSSYLEALFKLVQQYRGFIWWSPEGELFLKILEDDYTTPNITIDGSLITSLKFGSTDIRSLYTAVKLLYAGYEKGRHYESALTEDATAQLWYNVTQGQTLLEYTAEALKHLATVNAVQDYFLANHLNVHSTVECELPIMFNHLDIGDLVGFESLPENMRGHDLSASYTIAGQTVRPYFLINSVDRSDELKFEAFQIHKLD